MPCHTSNRRCSESTYRRRLTTILPLLLGLALLPSVLCSVGNGGNLPSIATAQQAAPVAVGFHFGQGYSTSVARFPDGTVVSLAKVPADDEYTALMERMVREPGPSNRLNPFGGLWAHLRRTLGMSSSRDATVLARMAAALKAKSEAALGGRAIVSAAVTVPWMAAWDGQIPSKSIINEVLVLAGMEPVSWEVDYPPYLGETNGLLAESQRWLCPDVRFCGVYPGNTGQRAVAFIISFTNQSLHTSFQTTRTSCFSSLAGDNCLSTIDPRYGLDKLAESKQPRDFWDSVRERILEQVAEHARTFFIFAGLPFLVLVAGEAAAEPGFKDALQEVVKNIPSVRIASGGEQADRVRRRGGAEQRLGVELIVPDDSTFAAARGAAIWMSMRLDGSHCAGWCAANPGECISQHDMHDEL